MGHPNGAPWMAGGGPAAAPQPPWCTAPGLGAGGGGSLAPVQQGVGIRGPVGAHGGAALGAAPPGAAGAGGARASAGAEPDQAAPARAAAGFLHRRGDRGDGARRGAEGKVSAAVVDARKLFCAPGRAKRPKRIAVVLRGLPGSGAPFSSPSSVRSGR